MVGQGLPGSFLAAPLIDEIVVADAKQPCVKVTAAAETGQVGEGFEKGFLGQVLGSMAMVHQMKEPAVQAVPVALDQHREGLPVALLGAVNEQVLLVRERLKLSKVGQFTPPCPAGQDIATRECIGALHSDCSVPCGKVPEDPAHPCRRAPRPPGITIRTVRPSFCWRYPSCRTKGQALRKRRALIVARF